MEGPGPKMMKNHRFLLVSGGSRAQNVEKPLVFVGFWSLPLFIPGSTGSSGSGPSTTARDLPTTRAGGQDDVSSKQTPSNE